MDGASPHQIILTIRRAAEEVILFCLPPHSTHWTQPLDKGCFRPLKIHWREECHKYLIKDPGKVITQYQFSDIFRKAWLRGMTSADILSGFRVTGFSSQIINPTSSEASGTACKRLPLCSPEPQAQNDAVASDKDANENEDDIDKEQDDEYDECDDDDEERDGEDSRMRRCSSTGSLHSLLSPCLVFWQKKYRKSNAQVKFQSLQLVY